MKSTQEAIAAIREGAEFRIETEDAHIIDFATGEDRYLCGVRVHLRAESGRWAKTALWLVINEAEGRPNTHVEALAALVRGLERSGVEKVAV